jgi:recombination protein RecA
MAKKETKPSRVAFMAAFDKDTANMEGVSTSAPAPKFWLDSGSYVINKILSGSYDKGFPTGRLAALSGPSGAGKSFIVGNAVKAALNQGWGVLVIDSENALDDDYLTKIGADVIDNPLYNYRGVSTISQVVEIVSKFVRHYKSVKEEMPIAIFIDSLDQLQTDSELEQYESGEVRGDQGQHAKQIKAMLKRFVADVKPTNIAMICVKQVYQEQDKIAALNAPWRMTESFKFAFSQIAMITKLLLKDKATKIFEGITLQVKGEKTRFAKPFQKCAIEVPYDVGIDKYSGLLEAAASMGLVEKNGAWYTFEGKKFQNNDSYTEELKEAVFKKLLENDTQILNVEIEGAEEDFSGAMTGKEIEEKRKTRGRPKKDSEAESEAVDTEETEEA